jgi:DNA modification methylase
MNLRKDSTMITLWQGDCLERMKDIPDKSIDFILTDPPYGRIAYAWDSIIPFEPMWAEIYRIIKDNGVVALFGQNPFMAMLICSNITNFKYTWIWDKKIPSGMCNAKIMPMRQEELIGIFIKGKNFYYPQMMPRDVPIKKGGNNGSPSGGSKGIKGEFKKTYYEKFPTTILRFDKIRRGAVHPTQKPIALLEYLIKTYTLEGETVLDFTMGSGSTGVAAVNLNRNFIGIELDTKYFEIASTRITGAGQCTT